MIRRATLGDIPVLVRHRRRMFEDVRWNPAPSDADDRRYRAWLRSRLKSGRFVAFVAEIRGEIAASGGVWLQEVQPRPGWPQKNHPMLLSMFTEPKFRGRGLASRIVRAAMNWGRERGYGRMYLHASRLGRPVYRKLGWERTWEMKIELAGVQSP